MPETAKRSNLVKVDGIDGYFAQSSGNTITASATQAWNGGDPVPARVAGPALPDNITVSKPYVPERDSQIIASLRPLVGSWFTTVSQQPTDASFTPIGRPRTGVNCLLLSLMEPDADASSGDHSTWSLVFAPSSVA